MKRDKAIISITPTNHGLVIARGVINGIAVMGTGFTHTEALLNLFLNYKKKI